MVPANDNEISLSNLQIEIRADIIKRCPHCIESEPTSVGTIPVPAMC